MSDDKIQLPNFLIAELYKGSLVELDSFNAKATALSREETPAEIKEKTIFKEKIRYLGENEKGVIIVVDQPGAVFLNEEELTFLTNILRACQLNLADIAIINLAEQVISYNLIKEQLTTSTILLFDVEPSAIKLPFLIPAFQLQRFDECTVMVAPALPVINKDTPDGKLLKTKLWMSLKKVFNIS